MFKQTLFVAVSAAALATATPASAVVISMTGTADGSSTIGPNIADPGVTSTVSIADDLVITDIDVEVNLQHAWLGDLIIELQGPDSTTVRLMGDGPLGFFLDDGGSGDNLVMTVFDDEASTPIAGFNDGAPFTGSFQPREALSIFDGSSSLGDWTLLVFDDEDLDGGTFGSWTITITSEPVSVSEPGALGLLGLGLAGLVGAYRRRR